MRTAYVVCIGIAFFSGIVASFFWFKSSGFKMGPTGPKWGLPGTGSPIEPVETGLKALDMAVSAIEGQHAFIEAMMRCARLNQQAAFLTSISVVASALASVLSLGLAH